MRSLCRSTLVAIAAGALAVGTTTVVSLSPVAASPAPASIPAPAGFQKIGDEAGLFTVSVPAEWEVRTEARRVVALGDSVTGQPVDFTMSADRYTDVPEFGTPYNDGWYVGSRTTVVGEDDTKTEIVLANEPHQYFTATLEFSYNDVVELETFETILSTFEATGLVDTAVAGPAATETTAAPTTAATTAAPAPAVPATAAAPAGTTEPAAGVLPPARPESSDPAWFWPYGEFSNVPQLGTEPVRGTGCGANGNLASVIPDGLWAGYVTYDATNDAVLVDVVCIYYGESAKAARSNPTSQVVSDQPDYLVVNNNTKQRSLRNGVVLSAWSFDEGAGCRPIGSTMPGPNVDHFETLPDGVVFPGLQAWVRVEDGTATYLVYGCDTGNTPGG